MRRTNSRCDQIIDLIDRCLAEYELATASPLTRGAQPKGTAR
jgi:hypothetical protein